MISLYFNTLFISLIIAYITDLIFGDPQNFYHFVQAIGTLISKVEKILLNKTNKKEIQLFKGFLLFIIVTIISLIITSLLLMICYKINYYLFLFLNSFLIYQCLATKSLKKESEKVYKQLKLNNLEKARLYLSYIVGRDTQDLNKEKIIKATIETIAENINDGIISPLFYITLLGPLGGILVKTINTLDSMVGYKNDKYKYFGTFSAKMDDIFQFIPSRLSAILLILSSFILKYNYKGAIKVFIRDRFNHDSPNSAQTESVCAGALDLQLAGPTSYNHIIKEKPFIGDNIKKVELNDIKKSFTLLYTSSIIFFLLCFILRYFWR